MNRHQPWWRVLSEVPISKQEELGELLRSVLLTLPGEEPIDAAAARRQRRVPNTTVAFNSSSIGVLTVFSCAGVLILVGGK